MAKFEATMDVLIHCRVVVVVQEAKDASDAISQACDILPQKHLTADLRPDWKFGASIKVPADIIEIKSVRPYFVEQASGGEKARRVKS